MTFQSFSGIYTRIYMKYISEDISSFLNITFGIYYWKGVWGKPCRISVSTTWNFGFFYISLPKLTLKTFKYEDNSRQN